MMVHEFYLSCDNCEECFQHSDTTAEDAVRHAFDYGWVQENGRDLCDTCSARKWAIENSKHPGMFWRTYEGVGVWGLLSLADRYADGDMRYVNMPTGGRWYIA